MKKESWRKTGSKKAGDFRIFSVRIDRAVSPETGYENDFTVLETVDWVNVVALTAAGDFVLVKQFRHGTGEFTIEIPGGAIDPGDGGPEAAAARELEEETGYIADRIDLIGVVEPNPAVQTNRCYTCLARGRGPSGGARFDIAGCRRGGRRPPPEGMRSARCGPPFRVHRTGVPAASPPPAGVRQTRRQTSTRQAR